MWGFFICVAVIFLVQITTRCAVIPACIVLKELVHKEANSLMDFCSAVKRLANEKLGIADEWGF